MQFQLKFSSPPTFFFSFGLLSVPQGRQGQLPSATSPSTEQAMWTNVQEKQSVWVSCPRGALRGLVGSQGELASRVSEEESVLNAGICMTLQSGSRRGPRRSGSSASQLRSLCSVGVSFSKQVVFTDADLDRRPAGVLFCCFSEKKKIKKSSLKSFDPLSSQTRIAVWNCFQSASAPYSGPAMCKPGSSKTYTSRLPRTGLSQGVFCTKAAPAHFLDLGNLFPRTRRVMTDDKRQVQPINRG